jgi:hypothetical protein
MITTTEAKNRLEVCRSKNALFSTLSNVCEEMGYQYDFNRSPSSNARCAAETMRYGVAEVIKRAEQLEGKL